MPTNQLNKQPTVSLVQQSMLVRFGQFGRNAMHFTTSVNGFQPLAPAVAQCHLDALEKLGLIMETNTGYKLTTKGRARMDGPGLEAAPAPRRPDYLPPKWEPARGAAADEHRKYKSLPVPPQIERALTHV